MFESSNITGLTIVSATVSAAHFNTYNQMASDDHISLFYYYAHSLFLLKYMQNSWRILYRLEDSSSVKVSSRHGNSYTRSV
ncbi:MAG: hypothetical protein [Cressdnaviricota sp.]|nr:MAG: hypothetical protein [Cressdnaviricota sp.]